MSTGPISKQSLPLQLYLEQDTEGEGEGDDDHEPGEAEQDLGSPVQRGVTVQIRTHPAQRAQPALPVRVQAFG